MISFLSTIILYLLQIRYSIKLHGLEKIKQRGVNGILFLPNHPAFIDPVIITTVLNKKFHARPFADKDAIDYPVIRKLVKMIGAFTIPTVHTYGTKARNKIMLMERCSIRALKKGENVIVYPSGSLMRSHKEKISGQSGVETIIHKIPDVRLVLIRTTGLYGSSFSMIYGKEPDIGIILLRGIWQVLSSFVILTPKREVNIYFDEPEDFPRNGSRNEINSYLEKFYNIDAPQALYVPYSIWEKTLPHEIPDPQWGGAAERIDKIPAATRELVINKIKELSGRSQINDSDYLGFNLGMDSLAKADLVLWIEQEFGYPQNTVESIQTVSDAFLAAYGEILTAKYVLSRPVPKKWFRLPPSEPLKVPPCKTITDCFLFNLKTSPNRIILGDQISGVKTIRNIASAVLVLLSLLKKMPDNLIGIMLPSSVIADTIYLTALFSSKIPVLINWTQGSNNIKHILNIVKVEYIITSHEIINSLKIHNFDLSLIDKKLIYVDDLAKKIKWFRKFISYAKTFLPYNALYNTKTPKTAVILFTSGSESVPKVVPLTHSNLLTDLNDTLYSIKFTTNDTLLGILPPFHSFGLISNVIAPLTIMLRTVHYPVPTDGANLAKVINDYGATVVLATPTFLNGILRAAPRMQLKSLHLAITGAEECPRHVYDAFADRCPGAVLIEGYGITECSPIISVNLPSDPHPGTIGYLIPSIEHAILDIDSGQKITDGKIGLLLVRGPTVFNGYIGDISDPFIEYEGKRWFKTGDIVNCDSKGLFTYVGRIKRFVKLGGEMISLEAIESSLRDKFWINKDNKPVLAVIATSDFHPQLTLYTTFEITRENINDYLKNNGFPPLYYIRKVVKVNEIPILGTGKIDYKKLESIGM